MTLFPKDSSRNDEAEINSSYVKYFISRMFGNAVLIILFTVMTFTDCTPCRDEQDRYYVSDWFYAAFTGGFALNAANFFFYAFGAPASAKLREQNKGTTNFTRFENYCLMGSLVLEILLPLLMLVSSALMFFLLSS